MEKQAIYERIGANIRRARTHRDLNQSHLADVLGVTRTAVTNMETGRQSVLVHQLLLIADVLDVPAVDLLAVGSTDPSESSDLVSLRPDLPEHLASLVMKLQDRVAR